MTHPDEGSIPLSALRALEKPTRNTCVAHNVETNSVLFCKLDFELTCGMGPQMHERLA